MMLAIVRSNVLIPIQQAQNYAKGDLSLTPSNRNIKDFIQRYFQENDAPSLTIDTSLVQ